MKACAVGATALVSTRALARESKRPNVVLIVSDDHGLETLGCYGNPVIKTPKAVPNTVPTPPNKEAPPMTQAAITANSIPLPFNGATDPNRKAWI